MFSRSTLVTRHTRSSTMSPAISNLLLSILVLVSCTCLVTSAALPSDGSDDMSILSLPANKRNMRDDISKILLKNLRFRDTDESEDQMDKRQKVSVSSLAALLSGLRQRQVEPSMRMPSLRFGK